EPSHAPGRDRGCRCTRARDRPDAGTDRRPRLGGALVPAVRWRRQARAASAQPGGGAVPYGRRLQLRSLERYSGGLEGPGGLGRHGAGAVRGTAARAGRPARSCPGSDAPARSLSRAGARRRPHVRTGLSGRLRPPLPGSRTRADVAVRGRRRSIVGAASAEIMGEGLPVAPVAAMTLVQAFGTMTVFAIPVMAPEMAPDLGVPPDRVGLWTSMLYVIATTVAIFCPDAVVRYGGVRISQAA